MTVESFLQKQQDTYEALFYLVQAVHAEGDDVGRWRAPTKSYELMRRMTAAVDVLNDMKQRHDPRRKAIKGDKQ
jgi:hypothetical protein